MPLDVPDSFQPLNQITLVRDINHISLADLAFPDRIDCNWPSNNMQIHFESGAFDFLELSHSDERVAASLDTLRTWKTLNPNFTKRQAVEQVVSTVHTNFGEYSPFISGILTKHYAARDQANVRLKFLQAIHSAFFTDESLDAARVISGEHTISMLRLLFEGDLQDEKYQRSWVDGLTFCNTGEKRHYQIQDSDFIIRLEKLAGLPIRQAAVERAYEKFCKEILQKEFEYRINVTKSNDPMLRAMFPTEMSNQTVRHVATNFLASAELLHREIDLAQQAIVDEASRYSLELTAGLRPLHDLGGGINISRLTNGQMICSTFSGICGTLLNYEMGVDNLVVGGEVQFPNGNGGQHAFLVLPAEGVIVETTASIPSLAWQRLAKNQSATTNVHDASESSVVVEDGTIYSVSFIEGHETVRKDIDSQTRSNLLLKSRRNLIKELIRNRK